MSSRLPIRRWILTATLAGSVLFGCADAPTRPTLATPPLGQAEHRAQLDSQPAPPPLPSADPGDATTQGCVEDQQEALIDPATGELVPCPLPGLVVTAPPPEPPPPPPPDEPPPPGGGGNPPPTEGVCDRTVDWDPDCPPPPVCGYLVSAAGECIPPPGADEQDEIIEEADAAEPPCPKVNDTPIYYAHDVPEDPDGEMAHFVMEKGYLSKIEDLSRGWFYSRAKYYNGRDILSENFARWVMRPGYINVKCSVKARIPLTSRKSFIRFTMTLDGSYDGKIERVR